MEKETSIFDETNKGIEGKSYCLFAKGSKKI